MGKGSCYDRKLSYQFMAVWCIAGPKPEQAFYVKVGLGQTMTFDDILNGK